MLECTPFITSGFSRCSTGTLSGRIGTRPPVLPRCPATPVNGLRFVCPLLECPVGLVLNRLAIH